MEKNEENLGENAENMGRNEEDEDKWLTIIAGRAIFRKRKLINMSQEELSVKLSLTAETVSRIENGYISLTMENLGKLCKIFSCPVEEFFQDYESTNVPTRLKTLDYAIESLEPEFQLEIISHLMNISDIYKKSNAKLKQLKMM